MGITFYLTIVHDRSRYRIRVEQLPSDESFDYFRVAGRNRAVIYRNNSPVLRRHSLKHRRCTWKVHEGNIWNAEFERKLLEAIEERVYKDPRHDPQNKKEKRN